MKGSELLIVAMLVGVYVGVMTSIKSTQETQKEIIIKLDSLEQRLDDRSYLDSLYWDHLTKCSFIDKYNVKVGHNGYLRTTYYDGAGHSTR